EGVKAVPRGGPPAPPPLVPLPAAGPGEFGDGAFLSPPADLLNLLRGHLRRRSAPERGPQPPQRRPGLPHVRPQRGVDLVVEPSLHLFDVRLVAAQARFGDGQLALFLFDQGARVLRGHGARSLGAAVWPLKPAYGPDRRKASPPVERAKPCGPAAPAQG